MRPHKQPTVQYMPSLNLLRADRVTAGEECDPRIVPLVTGTSQAATKK